MANKPCIGGYICPHCRKMTVAAWNGNIENLCQHCHRRFKTKRQKMINVKYVTVAEGGQNESL